MSLDGVEVQLDMERRFKIDLSDDAFLNASSVGALAAFISSRLPPPSLREAASLPVSDADVLNEVRRLLVPITGIDFEKIQPHSSFVRDLGF